MRILIKDIFEDIDKLDFIGITTNSTLNSKGHLVMGAGNAKQAKELCPILPEIFGKKIKEGSGNLNFYGILKYYNYFAFQTKLNWKDKSPLWVVEKSIDQLLEISLKHSDKQFGLPFPAINHGGLSVDLVKPLLEKLPDNVTIYKLPN